MLGINETEIYSWKESIKQTPYMSESWLGQTSFPSLLTTHNTNVSREQPPQVIFLY